MAYNPIQVIDRLLRNDPWHSYCLDEPFSFSDYFKNAKTCDAIEREELLNDDGSKSPFKFVKTPSAGIATFANRRIKRGELVLAEKPLLYYALNSPRDDYQNTLGRLTKLEKEIFYSLHDSKVQRPGQPKEFSGILDTNLFQTGSISAILPKLTRLNHACRPNVHYNWDNLRHVMLVHAQDDIEEGQEIYDSYIYFGSDTETRMSSLLNSYKFICTCQVCSRNNKTEVELSDHRRGRIEELKKQSQEYETSDPYLAVKLLEEVLEIFNLEDLMYYAQYPGSINELCLKILVNVPIDQRNVKLVSDYAKYTLGNYTIAFGKEFAEREYHWVKSYM